MQIYSMWTQGYKASGLQNPIQVLFTLEKTAKPFSLLRTDMLEPLDLHTREPWFASNTSDTVARSSTVTICRGKQKMHSEESQSKCQYQNYKCLNCEFSFCLDWKMLRIVIQPFFLFDTSH